MTLRKKRNKSKISCDFNRKNSFWKKEEKNKEGLGEEQQSYFLAGHSQCKCAPMTLSLPDPDTGTKTQGLCLYTAFNSSFVSEGTVGTKKYELQKLIAAKRCLSCDAGSRNCSS